MATIFTWEITGIKRVLADGGVLQAAFVCKAKDSKDSKQEDKDNVVDADFEDVKDVKEDKEKSA